MVDMAARPTDALLLQEEAELMGQLEGLTAEELEKMLEDISVWPTLLRRAASKPHFHARRTPKLWKSMICPSICLLSS